MKRLFLLISILVYLLYLTLPVNTQIIGGIEPIPFYLENSEIRLNFMYHVNKIDLLSIVDKDDDHTFDVSGILWKIRLIDLTTAPNYNEITRSQTELNCQTSYNILNDGSAQILYMNWLNCAVNPTNKFNLTITVRLDENSDDSDWRIYINSEMNDYSILYHKLFFGILENPVDYIVTASGILIKNPANTFDAVSDPLIDVGSVALPIKMIPYYTSANQGLYFWSKDDHPPHYQSASFSSDGSRLYYGHGFYPEYIGTAGNDFNMDYDFSIGVFNGDWYTAARLYRSWALSRPWANTLLINRNDIPQFWKELDLGEHSGHFPNANLDYEINSWTNVRNYYNATNLAVFYWGGATNDLQAQPWSSTIIDGLDSYGIKTFFYNNPQFVNVGLPFYTSVSSYTCRNIAGQPYIMSGIARMDYTNTGWHNWVASRVRDNLAAVGYKGMFFEYPVADKLCYNLPNPVGGINPLDGMIDFMNEVRSEARESYSNFILFYEYFYDYFIPVSDAAFVSSNFG
ncbi:MAG: DUF6259 domain-containing protein, partial [Nanoarchaeota archaeon]